ncbi:MAG: HK97 gp10 family phage protein [Clostridiales bacterium]|jgi:HK97 gp10 family phage protein|nr:HK97 gp10 family phage protein [Clostridiales bacterium]
MATATMKLPNKLLDGLSKLGNNAEKITDKMLVAGAKIIKDEAQSNLDSVVGENIKEENRSTGNLQSALGISPPKGNGGYRNVKIGFEEKRPDGKINALIANVLEYGKQGQPPKPFLSTAVKAKKSAAVAEMKRIFNEETKKE